ncbi:MAG: tetratricopeptide repeat protein [Alphaproteobacteria bacterium]
MVKRQPLPLRKTPVTSPDEGEDWYAVLRRCEKAVALAPNSAEAHNNLGIALSRLKRDDDAVASFGRAIELRPDFFQAHNRRGNSLQALGCFAEAVKSYSEAIALKADYAIAYANRGNALQAMRHYQEAIESYSRAIELKSDYVDAYNNRGTAFRRLGNFEAALADFDRSITLMPGRAELYSNRGNALHELRRFEDAVENYDTAISLNPDYPESYSNRGLALRQLGRVDDAAESFEKAVLLKPDYYDAIWNKALIDLELGRFDSGWRGYEARKRTRQPIVNRRFKVSEWLGETSLSGRRILVHWEQGFGDVIQFSRYIKLLSDAGATVLFAPQKELQSLMRRLETDVEIVDLDKDTLDFDVHCPLLSLPFAFGTDISTIPTGVYLSADPEKVAIWSNRLPQRSRPRVGVVWRGNPVPDSRRSIELQHLHQLLDPRIELISLQKEVTDEERAWLDRVGIIRVEDLIADFSDTAALCMLVDLVISVDTSVVHLAGALGVPVWVLLTSVADWRWLVNREDSPWYPAMRLFRQKTRGDWDDVLDRVEREIKGWISLRAIRPEAR